MMLRLVCALALLASVASAASLNDFADDSRFMNRIIGGDDADPHAYPFQVSLQMTMIPGLNTLYSHICGASIIDETHIVCAAHCLYNFNFHNMKVVAGAHNIRDKNENTRQVRKIASAVYHEDFNMDTVKNDVSIFKLSEPLEFNEYVQPIKMASPDIDPKAATHCKNSGWGKTSNGIFGGLPNALQVVDLPIVEQEKCENIYSSMNAIQASMICAGKDHGGPCNGDSGGPLFCFDDEKKPYLVGVVSWGEIPCGQLEYPGVYTRVSSFVDWIQGKVESM